MKKHLILYISLLLISTSFSGIKNKAINKDKFIVVLDAGHGGHDPGNLGSGFKEKDIALKIVLEVGKLLEKDPTIEVKYTRKSDVFVNLFERGEMANKANADLFVSVHCNSHGSSAHGTETFVLGLHANKQNFEVAKKENQVIYLEENYESNYAGYDINSPESVIGLTIMQEEFLDQSIDLAKRIQDNFTKNLKRVNRGVKQAGFIVLHQTFMPSVLVETGFLTYKEEGAYLNSNNGQSQMANAIAKAILEYKKGVQANSSQDSNIPQTQQPPTNESVIASPKEKDADVKIESPKVVDSQTNNTTSTAETPKPKAASISGYIFKVQLAASTKDIPLVPANFNGLKNISKERFKQFNRYLYGNTNSYEEAEKLKNEAIKKGYKTCYIVAYKNGERVSIPEELLTKED